MRPLLLFLLLLPGTLLAAQPTPAQVQAVFELAGIGLLCEQTEPLLLRGLPKASAVRLGRTFQAGALCADLAQRVAGKLDTRQLSEARALLESELARRFTAAERAVGEDGLDGLSAYRQQLASRPVRGARLELVRQLDAAAHTTELAYLLRYEVGKTQAWLVLGDRGEWLEETELARRTAAQAQGLRSSSAEGVESFMLYAYRHIPGEILAEYVQLHRQGPLKSLLEASAAALPATFAARRADLL